MTTWRVDYITHDDSENRWDAVNAETAAVARTTIERRYRYAINVLEVSPLPDQSLSDLIVPTRYSTLTATQKRRYQDEDVRRRVLVGARLPREIAAAVRRAAAATHRSIYRFVADAIDAELKRSTEPPPAPPRDHCTTSAYPPGTILFPASPRPSNPPWKSLGLPQS